jgi:hypothetical protein
MAEHEAAPEPQPNAKQTPRSRLSPSQRPPAITAKCPATSKRTGKPCGSAAGQGTNHVGAGLCKWHGGNSPGGIKHAARLKLEAELAALPTMGEPVAVDPISALLGEVRRCAGSVAYLGLMIRGLDPEDLTESTPAGAQTSALVKLWQQEREMLRKICADCVKAGVSVKRVEIEREKAQLIVDAIRGLMFDPAFQLTEHQRAVWPSLARKHLEAIPVARTSEREADVIDLPHKRDDDD